MARKRKSYGEVRHHPLKAIKAGLRKGGGLSRVIHLYIHLGRSGGDPRGAYDALACTSRPGKSKAGGRCFHVYGHSPTAVYKDALRVLARKAR